MQSAAAAREQLAQAAARDPLAFERWRVGAAAEKFHASPAQTRLLRAGNQTGKTRAGAREALWWLTGSHPYRATPRPPVRGRAVAYSWSQSVEVMRRVNELVPKFLVDGYDWNDSRGFVGQRLRLKNGSLMEITTSQQGTIAHGAAALDFVWPDEPIEESLYNELQARLLVRGGSMWMTCTPIGMPVGWLKVHAESGKIEDHRYDMNRANCPHLSQEAIDSIAERYLTSERPQRLHGHWEGIVVDRMIEAYDDRAWPEGCVDSRALVGRYRIVVGVDHGEGVGHEFAIVLAIGPGDDPEAIVLSEYVNAKRTDATEDARGIAAALSTAGIQPGQVDALIGDINSAGKGMAGAKVNKLLGDALAALWGRERCPFPVRPARKGAGSVDWGCRVINRGFLRRALFIHPRCRALRRALNNWAGDDDECKHGVDALRYAAVSTLGERPGYARLRLV